MLIAVGTIGFVRVGRAVRASARRLRDLLRRPQPDAILVDLEPAELNLDAQPVFPYAGPRDLDLSDAEASLAELDRRTRHEHEYIEWIRKQVKDGYRGRIAATNRLVQQMADQDSALRDHVETVIRDVRISPWNLAAIVVGTVLTLYPG